MRYLITSILLILALSGNSQTGIFNIIKARQSLELAGYKLTGVDSDTALASNSIMKIPTTYAIVQYVKNHSSVLVLGGSSGQVQYNNGGVLGALDSFTVAANPDRVGFGVPVPQARVDIMGSNNSSETNAFRIRNSAGTSQFTVDNTGVPIFKTAPTAAAQLVGFFGNNVVSGKSYLNISGNINNDAASATWSLYQNGSDFEFNYGNTRIGLGGNNGLKFSYLGDGQFRRSLNVGTAAYATNAGLQVSTNTTASAASVLINGTGFSGGTATTTKPTVLIEPSGTTSTGWSTSGTKLGVNAESGFSGKLLDLQINGTSTVSLSGSSSYFRSSNASGIEIGYAGSGFNHQGSAVFWNWAGVNSVMMRGNGWTIASNGVAADPNSHTAVLALNSTNRGFLPPRMTTAQRDAVAWVAGDNGMVIYCTDCTATDASTGVSQTWNGTTWKNHY